MALAVQERETMIPFPILFLFGLGVAALLVKSTTGTLGPSISKGISKGRKVVAATVDVVRSATNAAFDVAQRATLKAVLPSAADQYLDVILRVAKEDGVSPFLLASIMKRESGFGLALKPIGPAGTGDFIPRTVTNPSYPVPQNGKVVAATVKNQDGSTKPARKITPTTHGWGHGLMQIDLGSHGAFIASGKWTDPYENVKYGSKVLRESTAYVKQHAPAGLSEDLLARAGIAGYNTGAGRVVQSLKAGKDPDATTHGGDYSRAIVASALAWTQDFAQRIGLV